MFDFKYSRARKNVHRIVHSYVTAALGCVHIEIYGIRYSLYAIQYSLYIRLRSHRSRLFGYMVYVFEGTRILEIKHYGFLIPDHIGGYYSKSSYRRV